MLLAPSKQMRAHAFLGRMYFSVYSSPSSIPMKSNLWCRRIILPSVLMVMGPRRQICCRCMSRWLPCTALLACHGAPTCFSAQSHQTYRWFSVQLSLAMRKKVSEMYPKSPLVTSSRADSLGKLMEESWNKSFTIKQFCISQTATGPVL